jgi:hypothetical protein
MTNHGSATKLNHRSATKTCQQSATVRISPYTASQYLQLYDSNDIVSLQVINRISILLAIQFQSNHRPHLGQSLRSSLDTECVAFQELAAHWRVSGWTRHIKHSLVEVLEVRHMDAQ